MRPVAARARRFHFTLGYLTAEQPLSNASLVSDCAHKGADTFSYPSYLYPAIAPYDATEQATRASIRVFDPQHQHQAGMIGLVSNHRGAEELRLQGRIDTEQ